MQTLLYILYYCQLNPGFSWWLFLHLKQLKFCVVANPTFAYLVPVKNGLTVSVLCLQPRHIYWPQGSAKQQRQTQLQRHSLRTDKGEEEQILQGQRDKREARLRTISTMSSQAELR